MDPLLVIVAVIGAVVWNHKNQNDAMEGHRFVLPVTVQVAAEAIGAAYCTGGRAALKGFVSRVKVAPNGTSSFQTSTAIGDAGLIEVRPSPNGSEVHAHTERLHIGAHPRTVSNRSSLWGVSTRLSNMLYCLLGISVNATRMKRFQRTVEKQVNRQLIRSATS